MKLHIQFEDFRRAALLALLLPVFTVYLVRTEGSTSILRLPEPAAVNNSFGNEDASILESYLRSGLLWQLHVQSLKAIKQQLKNLYRQFSQLGELRREGTPRQLKEVDPVDLLQQSLAADFAQLLLIGVIAGLVCAVVNASSRKSAFVKIPFVFSANHELVPAGTYKVQLVSDHILSLVDIRTGVQLNALLVHPEPGEAIETRGRLIFHADGRLHVLTEVRIAGSRVHNKLAVQPSLDPELATQSPAEGLRTEIAMD